MSDQELFTTFVTSPRSRLLGVVRAMLELPWQTGADTDLEQTIDGVEVTSSDSADLHIVELIRSMDLEDDDGAREAAVRERSAPVTEGIVAALTSVWGESQVVPSLEYAVLVLVASDHVVEDSDYSMPGVSAVEERLVARLGRHRC